MANKKKPFQGGAKDQAKQLANKLREQMKSAEDWFQETSHSMESHSTPTKKQSRIAAKVTKGTSLSFNAAALKGVPGGHWTRMVLAAKTGTQTMSHERSARLTPELSRMNCYTTKSAVHSFGA